MLPNAVHLGMTYNNIYIYIIIIWEILWTSKRKGTTFRALNTATHRICQVLMQHLDGLEEVQQSHEFEMANLLAEP